MDLHIRESGETNAPALVFLHGGGVAGWMWDKQAEYFKDYHVIIPDLPGHGESAEIPFISINDAASKVLTCIREIIGNERIILIGFSLGAQLALEIMSKWPEKVDSAVILSGLVRPYVNGKYFLLGTLKMSFGLLKLKSFSKLQAKELYISEEIWQQYYQDSLRLSKDNFMRLMEANLSYGMPESFAQSDVRALVLVGEKEKGRMKESADDLVRANRNCTGYLVSNVGHGLSLAEPDLFNEIVHNFINNIQLNKNSRLDRIV